MRSSKCDPGPLGMLNSAFLAHFETVVTRFGPRKISQCPANGPFGTKSRSKMGQKRVFPKVTLGHLGCSNKCFRGYGDAFWPLENINMR